MSNGYDRVFTTVFDANLTTLITAFILYWVGTGPLRGFAVTLTMGIVWSMFTGLWLTKLVTGTLVKAGYIKNLRMMELFKVPNLKQHIIAGHKKLHHRAKEILTAAAAGLTHLHEKGWIHRDIKPDNFLVSDDNEVKLIDFNLARKPAGALGKLFGLKSKVQGTHSYMSPEQIRGQQLDTRTDVYSFGCMLHEFFSGKPPFTANSPNELLQRHLTSRPPDLTVIDKNINPDFARYVQSMMAKEPSARPAQMKEVMIEIKTQRIFYNPPQPPTPEEQTKAAHE